MSTSSSTGAPSKTDVLIVGAGPVGLTLAVDLQRRGVSYRIIDFKDGPTDQSRALGLHARTLEHLENLGVAGTFLERGRKVRRFHISDRAKTIVDLEIDLDAHQTPFSFLLILPQNETEQILIDRLRALGGEVEWKTQLQTFRQSRQDVIATVSPQGSEPTTIEANWIVGADGAHSAVRHGLNLSFEGAAYPESFLLADSNIDWDVPEDRIHVIFTPKGPLPFFPLPGKGRWRLIDGSGTLETNDVAAITKHFQEILHAEGYPGATVTNTNWATSFRIHRRMTTTLQCGRAFLAGDAGHIHSPAGGQGMNTGIQDACNLGWKLALVNQGKAPVSLLESYDAERHPIAARVLKGTDVLTKLITLRNRAAKAIRNRLMSFITKFGYVQRKFSFALSELDVHYRTSPIVAQAWMPSTAAKFSPGPFPGERVPDIHYNGKRLFDALGGLNHHLLLFDGESANCLTADRFNRLAAKLCERYGDLIEIALVSRSESDGWQGKRLLDDGRLHESFGADEPAMYLIRPDGYVGFRGRTSHGGPLEAFLKTIFI